MFKLVSVRRIMGTKHLRLFVLLCTITTIACTPVTVEKIKENRKSKQFFYALSPQPIGFIRPGYGVGIPQAPFATFRQPTPFAGYAQPAPFLSFRQPAPAVVPIRYYAPSVGQLGVASGNDLAGPTTYSDEINLASVQTPFSPASKPFATFPYAPPVGSYAAKEQATTNDEAETDSEEKPQLQFLVKKKKPAVANEIEISDPVETFSVNEVYDIFRQKLALQKEAVDSEKVMEEAEKPASNDEVAPHQAAVQETEATFGPAQAFIQQQESLADEPQVVKVEVESQKKVEDEKASSAIAQLVSNDETKAEQVKTEVEVHNQPEGHSDVDVKSEMDIASDAKTVEVDTPVNGAAEHEITSVAADEVKTADDSVPLVASEKAEDESQDVGHSDIVQQEVKSAADDEAKATVEVELPTKTPSQNDFAHRAAEESKPLVNEYHKEETEEESHNQQADQPHLEDKAEEVKEDVSKLTSSAEASSVMMNAEEVFPNDLQAVVVKNDEVEQVKSDAFHYAQPKVEIMEEKPVESAQNLLADSYVSEDVDVPADAEQEVNAYKVDIPVDDSETVVEVNNDEVQQIPLAAQDEPVGKQEMEQTVVSYDASFDSKPSFDVDDSTTILPEVAAGDDVEHAQPIKIHEENIAKDEEKIAEYDIIPEHDPSFDTEDSTTIIPEMQADIEVGPAEVVADEFVTDSATEINDEEGKLKFHKEVENKVEDVQAEDEKQSDVFFQTGNDVNELVKAEDVSADESVTTEVPVVEEEIKAEDVPVVASAKAETVPSFVEPLAHDNGHEAQIEVENLREETVKQKEAKLVADNTHSNDEEEEDKLLTGEFHDLQSDIDWTAFRGDPEVQGVKVVPLVAADETGDDQSDEQGQAGVEPQSTQDEEEQKEIEAAVIVNVIGDSNTPILPSLKTDEKKLSEELSSDQPVSGIEEQAPVQIDVHADPEQPETKEQVKEADTDVKVTVTSDEVKPANPVPEFVLRKLHDLIEHRRFFLAGDYLTEAGLDEMITNIKNDKKSLEELYSTIERVHVSDEPSLSRMSELEPENTNENKYAEIEYLYRKHAPFFHQIDLKDHKDIVVSMLKDDVSSLSFLARMKARYPVPGAEENINIPQADQQHAADVQDQENPVSQLLLQELKSVQAHQNSLLAGDYLTLTGLQAMSDDVETNKQNLEKLYTLLATVEATEDEPTLVNLGRTEVQGADGVSRINGLYRKYAHHLRGASLKVHKDLVLSMITHDGNALDFLARMKNRMNESDAKIAYDVPAAAPALEAAEPINDVPEQVVEAVAVQVPDNTVSTETKAEEELLDEVEAVVEIRLPENAEPLNFGTVVELSQDDIKEVQATYEKLEDSENPEPVKAGEETLPENQFSSAESAVQDDNHLNLPIEAVQSENVDTPLAANEDKTDDASVQTYPIDEELENQKEPSQSHDELIAPMEEVKVASYTVDEEKDQPVLIQAVEDDAQQVLNEPVAVYVKETDAVEPTGDSKIQDEVEAIVEVHELVSPTRDDTEQTVNDAIETEVVDAPVAVVNQLDQDSKVAAEMKEDDAVEQPVQVEINPQEPAQAVFQLFADSEIADLGKTNENVQTQYVQVEPVGPAVEEQGNDVIQRDSDPVESVQAVAELPQEPIAVQDYIAEKVEDAESVDALQPQTAQDAQQEERESVYGELSVQSQVLNPAEKLADPEDQQPNVYEELQVQPQVLDAAEKTEVEAEYQQPAAVEVVPEVTADEEKDTWLIQPVHNNDQDEKVEVVNDVPKEEVDEPQREWTVKVQPTHNGNSQVKVIGFTADDHPETYSSPAEASELSHGSRPNNKVLNADDNYVVIKDQVIQHSQSQLPENAQPEYLYDPVPVPVEQVVSTEEKKPADIVLDDGTVVQAAEKEDLPAKLPDSAKFRKIVVYEKDGKWFYAGTWRKRKTL